MNFDADAEFVINDYSDIIKDWKHRLDKCGIKPHKIYTCEGLPYSSVKWAVETIEKVYKRYGTATPDIAKY